MNIAKYIQPSVIDRETGISKDLLRKWRSRYGFPTPVKLEEGGQAYPLEQIKKLRLIKRLLDAGLRPATIIGKTIVELDRLIAATSPDQTGKPLSRSSEDAIRLLRSNDFDGLTQLLVKELTRLGLTEFVRQTVAPLAEGLGVAWAKGEIDVYHEHFCSDAIIQLLHAELSFAKSKKGYPRILFCAPPDERHILGMLMAQSVLAGSGANCISLSSHAPLYELKKAALAWQADIVGISFSFAFPKRGIRPLLLHLRTLLPDGVEIWAGGAGAAHIKRSIAGVRIFTDLDEPVQVLRERVSRK
jgi:hypothetical protein